MSKHNNRNSSPAQSSTLAPTEANSTQTPTSGVDQLANRQPTTDDAGRPQVPVDPQAPPPSLTTPVVPVDDTPVTVESDTAANPLPAGEEPSRLDMGMSPQTGGNGQQADRQPDTASTLGQDVHPVTEQAALFHTPTGPRDDVATDPAQDPEHPITPGASPVDEANKASGFLGVGSTEDAIKTDGGGRRFAEAKPFDPVNNQPMSHEDIARYVNGDPSVSDENSKLVAEAKELSGWLDEHGAPEDIGTLQQRVIHWIDRFRLEQGV